MADQKEVKEPIYIRDKVKGQEIIREFAQNPLYAGGRDRLWGHIKRFYSGITRTDVEKYLKNSEVHQVRQPLPKKLTVKRIEVSGPGKMWGVDLMDFQKQSPALNNNMHWVGVGIDLFSGFVHILPLKSKSTKDTGEMIRIMLDETPAHLRPGAILSDQGKEWAGQFAQELKKRGIKQVFGSSYAPQSNGVTERANYSIKKILFTLMQQYNSQRWVDFLGPIAKNMNNTKSRTRGKTPNEIHQAPSLIPTVKEQIQKQHLKESLPTDKVPTFEKGQTVRVALTTLAAQKRLGKFRKSASNQNWSSELYEVMSRSEPTKQTDLPQYTLKNLTTNRVQRKKYWGYQLSLVDKDELHDDSLSPAEVPSDVDNPRFNQEKHLKVDLPSRTVVRESPPPPQEAKDEKKEAPRRSARNRAPTAKLIQQIATQ